MNPRLPCMVNRPLSDFTEDASTVLSVDNVPLRSPKTYSTSNLGLIFSKFRPLIEEAERREENTITVFFQKDGVGAYSVISAKVVEDAMKSQGGGRG